MLFLPQTSAAAPQSDKDLAQQIFDTMVQLPGNKTGNRLVHAKGIVCQGTFTPRKNFREHLTCYAFPRCSGAGYRALFGCGA